MVLAGWLGLACAIGLSAVLPLARAGGWAIGPAVLVVPVVVSTLTLVGMRMLSAVPAQIRANWGPRH